MAMVMETMPTKSNKFPNDGTQWEILMAMAMVTMPTENPDKFPNEPTQWFDGDGDGYGNNQQGVNLMPSLQIPLNGQIVMATDMVIMPMAIIQIDSRMILMAGF